MHFDLTKYKLQLPLVRKLIKSSKKRKQSDIVSFINESTHLPLIVICYFVAGIMNKTDPDLKTKIDNIVAYYCYGETIGFGVFDDE